MDEPNPIKQLRFELTGQQAEEIVREYLSERMKNLGYELDYSRNEDGSLYKTNKPTEVDFQEADLGALDIVNMEDGTQYFEDKWHEIDTYFNT